MPSPKVFFQFLFIFSVILEYNFIRCTKKHHPKGCSNHEYTCKSGQCISKSLICDGFLQCYDGSDETALLCSSTICPKYMYRCDYGACVKISSICNGVLDCIDGSDESPQNSCRLPPDYANTFPMGTTTKRYTPFLPSVPITHVTESTTTKRYTPFNPPGWSSEYTPHKPATTPPAGTTSSTKSTTSRSTTTASTTPRIILVVTTPTSPSTSTAVSNTDGKCRLPDQTPDQTYRINDCEPQTPDTICRAKPGSFVDFGTVLFFRCESRNYTPQVDVFSTYCFDGVWTPAILECESCGALSAEKISRNDFPWESIIYQRSTNLIVCWGSVISPHVVISAAHCFYNENSNSIKDMSDFYIVAGKDVKNLNGNGQQYNISSLKFSKDGFLGSSTNYASDIAILEIRPKIEFDSDTIPVCLSWKNIVDVSEETNGLISTVKIVGQKGHLSISHVNYTSYENCVRAISDGLKQVVTLDKLCVFNQNIQRGNAGKGLYTSRRGGGIYRLRGIFSTVFVDSKQQVLTLTDITKHVYWLNDAVNEISQRRSVEDVIDVRFPSFRRIN